ncbi:uncharacterized protein KY384_006672 [Bacidia gigantensis]|uniref:uncharacterized protein n=1 Tax=Bacidia gigantensis TaxID=2732470 RepID=UPI001D03FEE1|nr:uncharacterized protein KY384_006672 [Bacidia gigantensis]KAG8528983.1 hypothetical protein KY384_006672 [Bacidia gigantensis]
MLRKFGRNKSSQHLEPPGHDGATNEPFTEANETASRSDHRSASEPSERLQASIPYHLFATAPKREHTAANSSFSGLGTQLTTFGGVTGIPAADTLGLSLLYSTEESDVDLIFVHGLGGSSRRTWSWNRDTDYFWPAWLPHDLELSNSRIFTFGYTAGLKGPSTALNVIDFAKDLLLRMLTFSGGPEPCPAIGSCLPAPYHLRCSLNGWPRHQKGEYKYIDPNRRAPPELILKQAYILGKSDKRYTQLVSQVQGMVFLSTPHKGSNYARTLNNILSAAPTASPKMYIKDLELNSTSIQVVEKDSGMLGYPGEISSSLNADHHSVCKYKTPEDPNYVDVRNVLKWMIGKLHIGGSTRRQPGTVKNGRTLQEILGIDEAPDSELTLYRSEAKEGTCRWITEHDRFVEWTNASGKTSKIYWVTGPPATGKSTLTSFVVEHLQQESLGKSCQYHFFQSSHQAKRTTAYCLRSIALQLALVNEYFGNALSALTNETGVLFGSQKLNFIWEKIFEGILFKTQFSTPLFWVIDALDEAESPQSFTNLFTKIRSVTPIQIFITSRATKELALIASSDPLSIHQERLSISDTLPDIRAYVEEVVQAALPYDNEFQANVVNQVLEKASGSFLWVRLALDTLKENWHTREDIRKALHDVPDGMESLYTKMIGHVMNQPQRLRTMALGILTWTVCVSRPLNLDELTVALSAEFDGFINLENTILQICGHFVRMEKSRIFMIHGTACQFLLDCKEERSPIIERHQAHEHIARRCLQYLSDGKWKAVFMQAAETAFKPWQARRNRLASFENDHPFLPYALQNWAFHVRNASCESNNLLLALNSFLERYCLTWIHAIALSGNLRVLTNAAQDLKAYVRKRGRKNSFAISSSRDVGDEPSEFLRLWAVDIIRIVGKFGRNLAENPTSIFRMIPPFCPRGTKMRETYGGARDNTLSVAGISSSGWDDCLARLNVGEDETVSRVLCTGSHFITLLGGSGTLIVWHAESCEEARRMKHGEWVMTMTLNKSGTLIATAGIHTFRVWDIGTGKQVHCLPKGGYARTMTIAFGHVDYELLIGRDDCSVSCYNLQSLEEQWSFVAEEANDIDHNCPQLMTFSPDINKVAIACRGAPVLVWDMTRKDCQLPRKCIRNEDRNKDSGDVWNTAEIAVWQPDNASLLILYQDTTLVEWRILEDEQDEYNHLGAREMIISQDGSFLLTSDQNGSLSVWTFPRLQLLYRLHYDEFVRDLAFSPDGQRIYDTRGSLCNVWEPDALVRPDEPDREDSSSNSEISIFSEPVFSRDDNSRNQTTALACDADDKFYCCGKDDGTISIHDLSEGKRLRKVYSHATTVSIISLAWSRSGKYIVSGDDCARVVAKRLEVKGPGKWAVYPIFDFRLSEPVEQFIFDPSEKLLLVSTRSGDRVWNLRSKEELCRRHWSAKSGRRWISHPLDDKVLLWIDPSVVQRYDWQTLACLEKELDAPNPGAGESDVIKQSGDSSGSKKAEHGSPASRERPALPRPSSRPTEVSENVNCISKTKNSRYIICETLPDTGHSRATSARGLRLELVPTSELGQNDEAKVARQSLDQLSKRVARLIGSYHDRVAFLDHQYWLCTWEIDTDFSTFKRHFFLPRDWLSPSNLELAALNLHGTFLCPKNGEVGIVRSGVKL